jgi:hypothetical protein
VSYFICGWIVYINPVLCFGFHKFPIDEELRCWYCWHVPTPCYHGTSGSIHQYEPLEINREVCVSSQSSSRQNKVTLRPTVSRPVRLGVRRPFGTRDQLFFSTVAVCYFVAPSLMRGRVCNLLLLLVLASTVPLGSALSDERSGLPFVSFVTISL